MTNDAPAQASVEATEREQVFADREWWRSAGNVINLELSGWTFRHNALFVDRETAQSVEMTGAVATRLIALSPPPTVGAEDEEPVAWTSPYQLSAIEKGDHGYIYRDKGVLTVPLYTRPSPSAVDVKGLEWSQGRGWPITAKTPFQRHYKIWCGKDVWFGDEWLKDRHAASYEEAKEWAQADYEQRIRSCIASEKGGA